MLYKLPNDDEIIEEISDEQQPSSIDADSYDSEGDYSIDESFYQDSKEQEQAKPLSAFSNKIFEKNALVNELNAAKTNQASLNTNPNFGSNLINNLEKIPLNVITSYAFGWRKILSYIIGFEWVFDLYRGMQRSSEKQNEADIFHIPIIDTFEIDLDGSPNKLFKFKMGTFPYPKHPISILFPIHYVAIHLGYLIGIILILPIALLLLPFAFIKAEIDTSTTKKEVQTKITLLEAQVSKQNEDIIKSAKDLIILDTINDVPDLYFQLKEGLDKTYQEVLYSTFTIKLEEIAEPNDVVQYTLSKIRLDNQIDKEKAIAYLESVKEDSPHYADAMMECGFYYSQKENMNNAKLFFKKLSEIDIPGHKEYLKGMTALDKTQYMQAKNYFEKAAHFKHPSAYLLLGMLHSRSGCIGAKNSLMCQKYLQQASHYFAWFKVQAKVREASAIAQVNLGHCYALGIGTEENYTKAIHYYQLAADQGNACAQYNLGLGYKYGEGLEKDASRAVYYFQLSANQEYAWAQYALGICYDYGCGIEKSDAQAIRYYQLAADQGYANAQYALGIYYYYGNGLEKDNAQAIRYYQFAADQGYANAQYALGRCYYYGNGVEKDDAQATRYYQLAADQGYANAQYALGVCYYYGQGVKKDDAQVLSHLQRAAAQGLDIAQFCLGGCYEIGLEVKKNKCTAVRYYQLAADQGYAPAQNHLGICYEIGKGVKQDKKQAVRYYRLAAEQGDTNAQCNLGWCYDQGEGVKQDKKEAARYYRLAAAQNYERAKNSLEELFKKHPDLKQEPEILDAQNNERPQNDKKEDSNNNYGPLFPSKSNTPDIIVEDLSLKKENN